MATKKTEAKEKVDETTPLSTRGARTAGAKTGREQREVYLKIKAFALEREEKNFSKLFLIHEKKNWWKMIGHSAILFHYEVSHWIGVTSKLVPDSDFDYKSEDGVVNIRDVYALDQKLAKVKIGALDIKDEYRVYNIGKKYTVADIEHLKKTKALEWAKINKIILPKEVFPSLYTSIRELLEKVYFATKRFDTYARDVIGAEMLGKVGALIREYSAMANKTGLSAADFLEETERTMQWVTSQMTIVAELRLLPPERIYQILRIVEKIRRDVKKCNPKKI